MKPGKSNYGKLVRYNISLNLTAHGQTEGVAGDAIAVIAPSPAYTPKILAPGAAS